MSKGRVVRPRHDRIRVVQRRRGLEPHSDHRNPPRGQKRHTDRQRWTPRRRGTEVHTGPVGATRPGSCFSAPAWDRSGQNQERGLPSPRPFPGIFQGCPPAAPPSSEGRPQGRALSASVPPSMYPPRYVPAAPGTARRRPWTGPRVRRWPREIPPGGRGGRAGNGIRPCRKPNAVHGPRPLQNGRLPPAGGGFRENRVPESCRRKTKPETMLRLPPLYFRNSPILERTASDEQEHRRAIG